MISLIHGTVVLLGWLSMVAGVLAMVVLCLWLGFKIYAHVVKWNLICEAMAEYGKRHPEKFNRFR